jgi:PAS domain S-box-containing protein
MTSLAPQRGQHQGPAADSYPASTDHALTQVFESLPDGILLLDRNWRITYANPRARQISRLGDDDLHSKTHWELYPETVGTIVQETYERVMETREEGHLQAVFYAPFQVWLNVRVLPVEDGIALYYRDVTEQKQHESALIQSEKLAAVGRMASSIAHEINNPLESVTNLLYIARSYAVLPEVQNLLDLADQELRRVAIIANQTLRFHKQASSPREVSCLALFSTVLSLFEGRLKNSAIQVEKRKRAESPVACFEGDIRQVLNNLVGNAIDAMSFSTRSTGGRLLLRSREGTDWRTGRRGLVLTVADTGPGMSPETQAHAFDAFFTTKGINGTGLGLWISSEIIARHEGRLLLRSSQSSAHHGTVFSLFLPFQALLNKDTTRPN